MAARLSGEAYDRLVDLLYQGALEQQPWQGTLPALREALARARQEAP